MKTKKLAMGLTGVLMSASLGFSNVQYISTSRSVQASGTVWPMMSDKQSQNDAKESSDDSDFDQTALINLIVNETVPLAGGRTMPNSLLSYAMATQDSSLTQSGISESGSLDYYTDQTYGGNGAASAGSSLAVTFSLDSAYGYSLFFMGGLPGETATLSDLSTGQVWDESNTYAQGVLEPGQYTLTHVVNYGQAYHDASEPLSFGLEMNFSPAEDLPEPGMMGLLGVGALAFMRRYRRGESGIGHCREVERRAKNVL